MAKKIYIGADSVARRVKKAYVGIDGLARRIKKAYIGIGGVARPCYATEPEYWGTTSQGLLKAGGCRASSSNTYAIFGSSGDASATTPVASVVSAYDKSLVRTIAPDFTYGRYSFMAAGIGEYVIFAGGQDTKAVYCQVDVYNASLTKVTADDTAASTYYGAGAKGKNHAFIIGGYFGPESDAYDASLTHTTFDRMLEWPNTVNFAATALGDYVIYGGGCKGSARSYQDEMCAVNSSLTVTSLSSLSQARQYLAAAKAGEYALFGGGGWTVGSSPPVTYVHSNVDAYNSSLTRSVATELSVARQMLNAASVESFAVFAGGSYDQTYYTATDVYDKSLTRTNNFELQYSHARGSAAEIGGFALFGGGFADYVSPSGYVRTDTVEAVTI